MTRFVFATAALLLTITVAGCNTFQGIGEDIQKGGQAIEKAATK